MYYKCHRCGCQEFILKIGCTICKNCKIVTHPYRLTDVLPADWELVGEPDSNIGRKGIVEGKIKVVTSCVGLDSESVKDKIVVLLFFNESCEKVLDGVKGVILQNSSFDSSSKKAAISACEKKKIPLLLDADNAMTLLCDDNEVVLDATGGFVYFTKDKM